MPGPNMYIDWEVVAEAYHKKKNPNEKKPSATELAKKLSEVCQTKITAQYLSDIKSNAKNNGKGAPKAVKVVMGLAELGGISPQEFVKDF